MPTLGIRRVPHVALAGADRVVEHLTAADILELL
jgi:hypothetical protein